MRNCFLLCGTAVAGVFLLNTIGAIAQIAAAPQPASQAATGATGENESLKLTAIHDDFEDDPVARLLDAHPKQTWHTLWKFDLSGSKPTHPVDLLIEEQEKDKSSHLFLSLILKPEEAWPINGQLSIFVNEHPLEGDIIDAAQIKYQIWVSSFEFSSHKTEKGFGAMAVLDNPFHAMRRADVGGSRVLYPRPDGSFVLNEGYYQSSLSSTQQIQEPTTPPDKIIVFRMQPEPTNKK